jgi:hypothetical protein
MSKPEITTQISIQTETDYWFTVEDVYLDLGEDGLTISYWSLSDGNARRAMYICMDEPEALAVADSIYKLFKKEDNLSHG